MRRRQLGWRIQELQAVADANGVEWHLQRFRGTGDRYRSSVDAYQFTVRPLSKGDGGGYLVEYPDILGCMSDGETVEEAIANGREALRDCIEVRSALSPFICGPYRHSAENLQTDMAADEQR